MPQFTNAGIGLTNSLTQDPLRPIEFGRGGKSAAEAYINESLAVGDALVIREHGADYTAATDVATTNVTEANNTYLGDLSPGVALSVDTTVVDGRVTAAVVRDLPTTDYRRGDLVSVDGNTAGSADCILMIP